MSAPNTKGEMEQKLAEMGSKIDELRAQASQARAEKKAELNKQITQLQVKKELMQQRLDE
jgi:vacuolar-type H+-ATPase subunit I/STV1